MKKIIAFGGSPSRKSINKQLATYTAHLFPNAEVEILDLNDFEMPIFSVDREKVIGIHPLAQRFFDKIGTADFLVISLAENNGAYSAAFKNVMDWTSRIPEKFFQDKPMLLMATSDGARGARLVLEMATSRFPRHGADIKATFSLPSFYENFNPEMGITNTELKNQLLEIIHSIEF